MTQAILLPTSVFDLLNSIVPLSLPIPATRIIFGAPMLFVVNYFAIGFVEPQAVKCCKVIDIFFVGSHIALQPFVLT